MASHSNKRVLITGIEGFTGKYCESYFKHLGFDVYGTVLQNAEKSTHFECDIRDKASFLKILHQVQPTHILHLAAISFAAEENASLIYDINVIATEKILEALVESGLVLQKVLLASSATVYGNVNVEVLDESYCPNPVSHYGSSKLIMEHMAKNYFDRLPIIITRMFNYSGRSQEPRFLVPKIVNAFRNHDRSIELGNVNISRDFSDVRWVAQVYASLLLSTVANEVINVSSNKTISLKEIVSTLENLAGYHIQINVNEAFVRKNDIVKLRGNNTKLFTILDEVPHMIDFRETLQWMYEEETV